MPWRRRIVRRRATALRTRSSSAARALSDAAPGDIAAVIDEAPLQRGPADRRRPCRAIRPRTEIDDHLPRPALAEARRRNARSVCVEPRACSITQSPAGRTRSGRLPGDDRVAASMKLWRSRLTARRGRMVGKTPPNLAESACSKQCGQAQEEHNFDGDRKPYLLFLGDVPDPLAAKTALRHRRLAAATGASASCACPAAGPIPGLPDMDIRRRRRQAARGPS